MNAFFLAAHPPKHPTEVIQSSDNTPAFVRCLPVAIIAIAFAFWSAAASAVHPADAITSHRWGSARQTRPL